MAGEANSDEFQYGTARFDDHRRAAVGNLDSNGNRTLGFDGGLRTIDEMKVRRGSYLYRFGNSAWGEDSNFASGWWITDDTLFSMASTTVALPGELVRIARMRLAIATKWSKCDVLCCAQATATLRAFYGEGRLVLDQDDTDKQSAIWLGDSLIPQLYIPGLFTTRDKRRTLSATFHAAMRKVSCELVAQFMVRRQLNFAKAQLGV